MKKLITLLFVVVTCSLSMAQELPNLPIPIGAGNAEVWNNAIYLFGGANNWAGSVVYPRIYKFNGTSWVHHDSIPDYNLWDVETVRVGNYVYLLGGWPYGPSLNRRYNLTNGEWVYLTESPNTSQTWGITSEEINGIIYLFNSNGAVYAYNISTNSWSTKTSNTTTGTWDLSSILYNGEIYIIGWNNNEFYKYTPATDTWTRLADSPYKVGACSFGVINNLIYCIGGNNDGSRYATYKSIIVYDINTNSWVTDPLEISSKRHWMATAEYAGGLYIVGGIDDQALAVDIVEEIVPQGTVGFGNRPEAVEGFFLGQNFPNPVASRTLIFYTVPESVAASLKVFDELGKEVATLAEGKKTPGSYVAEFSAQGLKPGIYYYRLDAGKFVQTKKMIVK